MSRLNAHALRKGLLTTLVLALASPLAVDAAEPGFRPGGAGAGDPYFPTAGNGGYDVRHYRLDLRYQPKRDRLSGSATIEARATQNLSRFNLDLDRLTVQSVEVDGRKATWQHRRGELVVDPAGRGLRRGKTFRATITYHGSPKTLHDNFGASGVFHTDDGLLIAGQPLVASTWFPVNDHPTDKASFSIDITAPKGREAIANGILTGTRTTGGWTTWSWTAKAPMAPYLATVNVGEFDVDKYRQGGIRYWDAIDSRLLKPVARPRTGSQFMISGQAHSAYKRLKRRISVPPEGAHLSFRVKYDIEPGYDFLFVEARPVGTKQWTTLKDERGHTRRSSGLGCRDLLSDHGFLRHYLTKKGSGCEPHGSTGQWHATSGKSRGYEHWTVDLLPYAGGTVEISITHVSDFLVQHHGVFVDDIEVSTGEGSTSFEADSDPTDGWTVPGPPPSSPGNESDWINGTSEETPPSLGDVARTSLDKQSKMIRVLVRMAGPYPFATAGGIVDKEKRMQFALETQTRPVYGDSWFYDQRDGDLVVVHELAHQWYGNSVTLRRWHDIWLHEGFATYAEWLWLEYIGEMPARRSLREAYNSEPARSRFWRLNMVDPGPDALFEAPIYVRGAMVLQALRQRVGDETFFRFTRRWAQANAGRNVSTSQLIRLAERVSGEDLDRLFDRWLFAPRKPRWAGAKPGGGSTPSTATRLARNDERTPR